MPWGSSPFSSADFDFDLTRAMPWFLVVVVCDCIRVNRLLYFYVFRVLLIGSSTCGREIYMVHICTGMVFGEEKGGGKGEGCGLRW